MVNGVEVELKRFIGDGNSKILIYWKVIARFLEHVLQKVFRGQHVHVWFFVLFDWATVLLVFQLEGWVD